VNVAHLSNYFFNDRIPQGMGSLSGNLWGKRTLFSLPFSSHVLHFLQKRMKRTKQLPQGSQKIFFSLYIF
jgi:hypothetical protein